MKLRMLRLNAGLSPEDLGKLVDLSGMTIRRLEAGQKPNAATAYKVASHFNETVTNMWPDLVDVKAPTA